MMRFGSRRFSHLLYRLEYWIVDEKGWILLLAVGMVLASIVLQVRVSNQPADIVICTPVR